MENCIKQFNNSDYTFAGTTKQNIINNQNIISNQNIYEYIFLFISILSLLLLFGSLYVKNKL